MNNRQIQPDNTPQCTLSPQYLHDLLTPLNQIIGYSDMLAEQAAEDGHRSYVPDLQHIHAAGRQLLDLLKNEAPLPEAEGVQPKVQPAPEGSHSGAGAAMILVVDDIKMNRDLLARRLESQGHTVAFAENGQQAMDAVRTRDFDLVLLDIMMPEMDGYEALRQLKADKTLMHIPVIMISALDGSESVVRCIKMGADDYLPKPFDSTLLKARIGACLEKKRAHDREVDLYQQLRNSYRSLQEAEKMRDDLTHMIVHDLRTPLGSLISAVQTLEHIGDLNPGQKEIVAIATSGGATLLEMINGLLDVNKMESGSMELNYALLDPAELVLGAIRQVAQLAKDRKLNLVEDIEADLPPIEADEDTLIRTLVNLLGNAIKFTPDAGTITVSVKRANDRSSLSFAVSDTGEGIPGDSIDRIFEKFGQVESRQGGRVASTGLGLTFCKLVVEAHGGQIKVESSPGKGSSFSFTLPLRPPLAPSLA